MGGEGAGWRVHTCFTAGCRGVGGEGEGWQVHAAFNVGYGCVGGVGWGDGGFILTSPEAEIV